MGAVGVGPNQPCVLHNGGYYLWSRAKGGRAKGGGGGGELLGSLDLEHVKITVGKTRGGSVSARLRSKLLSPRHT
jgi:hypothetical protein